MPNLSKNIGAILFLLGIISYFITGMESLTALIPSFFGIALWGLGILGAKSEPMRKHAMHGALLLAILGLAGSYGGLIQVFGALGGASIIRPAAAYAQSIMAILCIYFLIMGIRSFVTARQATEE
ncbi:MAG: hypothetical protein WD355_02990 [Balneolaceae bacterium]